MQGNRSLLISCGFSTILAYSAFPNAWMLNEEVIPQVTPQVEQLLLFITAEHSRVEIQASFGLADKRNFVDKYLSPALHAGLIEMTIGKHINNIFNEEELDPI